MSDHLDPVYMDNGATSFPKPPRVWEAMEDFIRNIGGSPGRSGHRLSQKASRVVFECREAVASLFGIPDSGRIVFTMNATEGLNTAILGVLGDGDRVVTTSMEHNSVMRPLRSLVETRGIVLEVVQSDDAGRPDLDGFRRALEKPARLVAVNHASNVTGAVFPLSAVGALAREAGALLLVDAAQSAGVAPIDVVKDGIDLLAFTGHKGLLGPQGTGGLWVRKEVEVEPLYRGGTGSNSELEEQPDFYPDRLESGTQNALGLAGLKAGVEFILEQGVDTIRAREEMLMRRLMGGLEAIEGLTLYGPGSGEPRTAVLSLTFAGMAPSEAGFLLDDGFGILTRVGLHCAPGAHRSIGTYPSGTVRLSPGFFNTEDDIDRVVAACVRLAGGRNSS